MRKNKRIVPIILTILLLISLCCLAVCLVLFAGSAFLAAWLENTDTRTMDTTPMADPLPTPEEIIQNPVPFSAYETLETHQNTIVPINDPIELAERLGGMDNVPEVLMDPNAPYAIGDRKEFWVTNVDTNTNFKITALMRYLGEHTYFWIEEGVEYDELDLIQLGDTFDQKIVPTNRAFFGTEWNPGVDGDPRIHIVYAGGLGRSLAGYFSSADALHPLAHEYSNAHEMFLINSDTVFLWEEYIYGTLAHEYQHMIHWYNDRNETTWLNEGFSMLAELINGYDVGGHDYSYMQQTDIQLTDWGDEVGDNSPYYGASFLFTTYFFDRFGEDVTKALATHPENGMESIDLVLGEFNIIDPITNELVTAEDVFADWAVANVILDSAVADGRYNYTVYDPPKASITETVTGFTSESLRRTVHQFGVDTISVSELEGDVILNFKGSSTVNLLPADAFSGQHAFYSNKGDESHMSLTREFDFTSASAPIEMRYYTWYDLEEDYDYLYLTATVDGENWEILTTPSCTTLNPSGNSYGCGYNGSSSGWIEESVDLSKFAGNTVTLSFEYITDAAVNGEGLLLDDVRVDAIGYFSDFENDNGGWHASGFVRVTNILPQTFRVSLIQKNGGTTVESVDLSEDNTASIKLNLGGDAEMILVISGTTPFTNQTASYEINLER